MRNTDAELELEGETYKTILESTKAIPWRLDWRTQKFTYIGPQIERLLGWRKESWTSASDWARCIYASDRERVVGFCLAQSQGGFDHEAIYRALTPDGSYVWVREIVHVIRNRDEVEALVGFILRIDHDHGMYDGLYEPQLISRGIIGDADEEMFRPGLKPRDSIVGQLIHGRYHIEKRIGKGGMGTVYLAEHVLLRKKVAIKLMSSEISGIADMVERFKREATVTATIANEHVVRAMDMSRLSNGTYYLVCEHLDGFELSYAVETDGAFSIDRTIDITAQICAATTAVHDAGVVHRDLKPENIFLVECGGRSDFVKLLDFGICSFLQPSRAQSRLTHTNVPIGTPHYMSPEQIESPTSVDARTDIYAIGALMYYMLTASPPHDGPTLPSILMKICSEPITPLRDVRPDVPAALEAVVERALARRPCDRFSSTAELRLELARSAIPAACDPSHVHTEDAR